MGAKGNFLTAGFFPFVDRAAATAFFLMGFLTATFFFGVGFLDFAFVAIYLLLCGRLKGIEDS
jgi:hypothetical protein